jgi:hypothetical protein
MQSADHSQDTVTPHRHQERPHSRKRRRRRPYRRRTGLAQRHGHPRRVAPSLLGRARGHRTLSRRIATRNARIAVNVAAARLIAAAQALHNGTGTIDEWRRAFWAELAARAAVRALERGFGEFRG